MGRTKVIFFLSFVVAALGNFSCAGPKPVAPPAHLEPLPSFPSQFVEVNGARTHFIEMGRGRPLLLLHGVLGDTQLWCRNLEALAKHFHVVAVDFPGFGLSEIGNNRCTIDGYTRFVKAFADKLKWRRFSIIGISLGGHVALNFVLRYPDSVDKLVLVSTTGGGRPLSPWAKLGLDIFYHKPLLEAFLSPKILKEVWDAQYCEDLAFRDAYYAQRPELHTRQGIKIFLRAFGPIVLDIFKRGLRGETDKIEAPTLIIWSQRDPYHSSEEAAFLDDSIPDSTLIAFPCGHMIMAEMPEPFNRAVLDFLLEKKGGDHE